MIARQARTGRGPTVIFCPGYASDMAGAKATALDTWATQSGRAFVRFDYRGCGDSGGRFEDHTLADWRDDVLAQVDAVDGPVVLVGSSMGGWLILLAALARPDRVAGLVGIVAAPDFTDWGFDAARRAALMRDGIERVASPYGGETITTRAFWESGQALRVRDRVGAIACPVHFLHGQADADVPWMLSLDIAARIGSADVTVTLIKDGDHRLSREADIARIVAATAAIGL